MVPPRISIAGLLGVVLACGLGCAALVAGTGYWAAVMVTLTLFVLLAAVVGAAVRRPRAGRVGFAVFGWGYFVVAFGPWLRDDLRPHLLTSVAIAESFQALHGSNVGYAFAQRPQPGEPMGEISLGRPGLTHDRPDRFEMVPGLGPTRVVEFAGPNAFLVWGTPDYFAYERSAHALATWLFGLLGALTARLLASRDEPAPPRSSPDP